MSKSSKKVEDLPKYWVKKMRTQFKRFDADGDGVLTKADHILIAERLIKAGNLSGEEANRVHRIFTFLWDDFSTSKTQMTEEEMILNNFKFIHDDRFKPWFEDQYKLYYDAMDVKKTGQISLENFKSFYAVLGIDATFADAVFAYIDDDSNGLINRGEFMTAAEEYLYDIFADDSANNHFWGPLLEDA
ncbi:unnamed protein product [Owenia fusiformis]|uniref:Uncharacterized protein n=1 Tax=Owenia fusiformis TaxID=6347 RepID=A0A8J1TZM1_OWEFU|nr:unnamed protein product [Owenia fusiformis]